MSTALHDAAGTISQLAYVVQDITAGAAVDDHARFQAYLLDHVQQAAIATDPNGRVVYWNRAAEDLYGWKRDEVIGTDILKLTVTPSDEDKAAEIMSAVRSGNTWTGEFDVRARDGRIFPRRSAIFRCLIQAVISK